MGLGTEDFPIGGNVRMIAALAYQLMPDSRVRSAAAPAAAHGLAVRLLRAIEHNQRLWHWANSKDAKNEDTAPERMLLPGEEEAYEKAVNDAEKDAQRAADFWGIKL